MKIAETYRKRVMGNSVHLNESKYSDKLIDALEQCIDSAPEKNKNKLAQVFEDYQAKFGNVPGKRLPYMLQGFFDAIEEASGARVEKRD